MSFQCRVCLDDENTLDNLIAPCKCNGSVKYIHTSCHEKWIGQSMNNWTICPNCKSRYNNCTILQCVITWLKSVVPFIDIVILSVVVIVVTLNIITICENNRYYESVFDQDVGPIRLDIFRDTFENFDRFAPFGPSSTAVTPRGELFECSIAFYVERASRIIILDPCYPYMMGRSEHFKNDTVAQQCAHNHANKNVVCYIDSHTLTVRFAGFIKR